MRKPSRRIGVRFVTAFAALALVGAFGAGSAGAAGAGSTCLSTFRVLNNDRIDNMSVPAGDYQIRVKRMTCQSASNYFKQFLAANQNNLPKGWTLHKGKQKFKNKSMDIAFRIKLVS